MKTETSYCFGLFGGPDVQCTTGWWALSSGKVVRTEVPLTSSVPDDNYTVCPDGYVMVGIKNSSPAKLICQQIFAGNAPVANPPPW